MAIFLVYKHKVTLSYFSLSFAKKRTLMTSSEKWDFLPLVTHSQVHVAPNEFLTHIFRERNKNSIVSSIHRFNSH